MNRVYYRYNKGYDNSDKDTYHFAKQSLAITMKTNVKKLRIVKPKNNAIIVEEIV